MKSRRIPKSRWLISIECYGPRTSQFMTTHWPTAHYTAYVRAMQPVFALCQDVGVMEERVRRWEFHKARRCLL